MVLSRINNRILIKISGEDSQTFLQGLITANIKDLESKNAIYSLMLSSVGKFIFDFFIIKHNDYLILDTSEHFYQSLMKKMQFYKLHSKVAISILEPQYNVYYSSEAKGDEAIEFLDPRSEKLGWRLYSLKNYEDALGEEYYQKIRIENLLPEATYDLIEDKSFPMEYGFDKFGTLNLNKGCYVGQEVVTRTFHRGAIRKSLCLVKGDVFPESKTNLENNSISIGTMGHSTNNYGLMLLRDDFIQTLENNIFLINSNEFQLIKKQ